MKYTYQTIQAKAKTVKSNIEKKYENGIDSEWCFYFGSLILAHKKDVTKKSIGKAPNQQGEHISRGISRDDYTQMAKDLVKFVNEKGRLPNFITYKGIKIAPHLLTGFFGKVVANNYPKTQSISRNWYVKPSKDSVFDYFCKVFGKVTTIDGALNKVINRGYGHYFDNVLTNKQTIDHLKNGGQKPNCTDACHVFWHIAKALGYDVVVEHVQCSGGDGHVRLKLRHKKHTGNAWIRRDPACVCSNNGKPVNAIWCDGARLIDTNPSWFFADIDK